MLNSNVFESIYGCLIGGAIGDSMGQPFENKAAPIEYQEYSPWRISDDTQMTLATCEAIIKVGQVSPKAIAEQFLLWYRKRKITGMGASTLKALRDLDMGAHWALSGAQGENSLGNGAAMRIAPLAFFLDATKREDRVAIRDVCRITHQSDEAYIGALAILLAIQTPSIEELFSFLQANLPDSRVRDRIVELNKTSVESSIGSIAFTFGASGYVVESVPLALYAAQQISKSPFQQILVSVVETGGDTDTIASMTGQIVGAWIGSSQIPKEQFQKLPNINQINQVVEALFRVLKGAK